MNWNRLLDWLGRDRGTILALSGGGARGLAHIGVLEELERNSLKPDMVTGTSMGAIIGALYCLHGNSNHLEKTIRSITESDEFQKLELDDLAKSPKGGSRSFDEWGDHIRRILMLTKMIHHSSIMGNDLLKGTLERLFEDATFEDMKIPFIAMATDLISGEDVHFSNGPLVPAITASASIPGVFPPIKLNGKLLVDGCVTMNVPIPEEDVHNHKVIAVDVLRALRCDGPYNHGVDILARTDWITQLHLNRFYLDQADFVIQPQVKHVHWADFNNIDGLIQAGQSAVTEKFEKIKNLMN